MRRPVVLVVEDDDDLRASLIAILKDEGYDAREASGGVEAMKVLVASSPDLILLDMMMQHGNGWEFLHHLRGAAATVPVVVISALTSSVPPGARALLRKPVQRGDLLATAATFAPWQT